MTPETTPILPSLTSNSSATAAYILAVSCATLVARLHVVLRRRRSARTVKPIGKGLEVGAAGIGLAAKEDDEVARAKAEMIAALRSGRDEDGAPVGVAHPSVAEPLSRLREAYRRSGVDARSSKRPEYDGDYVMEHGPSFMGLQGHNSSGDPMFTMGRMTFSMIRPTDVLCSIQRVTQHVHRLERCASDGRWELPKKIPPKLRDDVEARASELRTFVTYMYFTVESDPGNGAENQQGGPRGVMRMDGYCFPHPTEPNRVSVWFTGGVCSPQNGEDMALWRKTFGRALPRRPVSERVTLFMAGVLMGAVPSKGLSDRDGSMTFDLKRPVAAHQDVAYLDNDLRVTVGSRGAVVVVSRLRDQTFLFERKSSML